MPGMAGYFPEHGVDCFAKMMYIYPAEKVANV